MNGGDRPGSPAVDVRIPVWGRDRFLAGAIESVLAQTHEAWSLVVSENGPPSDEVAAAVTPYLSHPRVAHVRREETLSAAAHHTTLVRSGSAPYVAVLHDDDRWHPGFLRDRVEALEAPGGCSFAFSGARIVDDRGRTLTTFVPDLSEGRQASETLASALYGGNFIHVSTTVLRRAALEALGGGFAEAFPMYDDHELWFRLALAFPAAFLRRCDVDLRRHESQLSHDRPLRGDERLRLLDHFDALLAGAGTAVPEAVRRRARSEALLTGALDAVERGQGDLARTLLARAAAERPEALLGGKAAVAGAASIAGSAGVRAVRALRRRIEERRPFA